MPTTINDDLRQFLASAGFFPRNDATHAVLTDAVRIGLMAPGPERDRRKQAWHNAQWFRVSNSAAQGAAEIYIYDSIGAEEDMTGIGAEGFREELEQIPRGRPINVRLNSPGGNVWAGASIYRQLNNRKDDVTCYVDGTAASIAAVIACAGKTTVIRRDARMMIHACSAWCQGNSRDMRECGDKLEAHDRAIAGIISDKTGTSQDEVMAILDRGEPYWMDAGTAIRFGIADSIGDAPLPSSPENNAAVAALQSQIQTIGQALDTERRSRITEAVRACVDSGCLPASTEATWIERAMKDESIVKDLFELTPPTFDPPPIVCPRRLV